MREILWNMTAPCGKPSTYASKQTFHWWVRRDGGPCTGASHWGPCTGVPWAWHLGQSTAIGCVLGPFLAGPVKIHGEVPISCLDILDFQLFFQISSLQKKHDLKWTTELLRHFWPFANLVGYFPLFCMSGMAFQFGCLLLGPNGFSPILC